MQDLLIQTVAFDLLIPLFFHYFLKKSPNSCNFKNFYLSLQCYILLKALIGKRRD